MLGDIFYKINGYKHLASQPPVLQTWRSKWDTSLSRHPYCWTRQEQVELLREMLMAMLLHQQKQLKQHKTHERQFSLPVTFFRSPQL
jgi:hypothetical protein